MLPLLFLKSNKSNLLPLLFTKELQEQFALIALYLRTTRAIRSRRSLKKSDKTKSLLLLFLKEQQERIAKKRIPNPDVG